MGTGVPLPGAVPPAGRPIGPATGATAGVVELAGGPVDLGATLAPLRRHGDDLLDRWDGHVLRRTAPLPGGGHVAYAAEPVARSSSRLRVRVARPEELAFALAAAGDLLIVTAGAALDRLRASDPVIALLEARHPGVRQVLYPDLYAALVRAISAQQVNLGWAATTRRRLAEAFGDRHALSGAADDAVWSLDPQRVAGAAVADLRALQFTTRKAEYLVGAAAAVAGGGLDPAELAGLPDAEVVERLVALRGIGRWTAEWVLARSFGRPVVVAGDLGVRKAVAAAYAGQAICDEARVRGLTAHWGEAAAAAQWLLLHALAEGTDLVAVGRAARAGGSAPGRGAAWP